MSRTRPIKLLLLGTLAVGKSSFARRLSFDTFDEEYKSTIGVQLHKLDVELDAVTVPVVLWDTDGDLGVDALASVYARGSSGALILGDAQRPDTLDALCRLARAMPDDLPGRPAISVINKVDICAPTQADMDKVVACGFPVLQTSARTGAGVKAALRLLVEIIVSDRDES